MTVYIDDARIPFNGRRWSHMVAESAEELHRAAQALGLKREWAQDRGRTLHYDLPEEWRQRAIDEQLATPIAWRELVRARGRMATGRRAERGSTVCVAEGRHPLLTSAAKLHENRTISRLRS